MKNLTKILVFAIVFVIIVISLSFYHSNTSNKNKVADVNNKANASSQSSIISDTDQWTLGTLDNIDISESGKIKISDKTNPATRIDYAGADISADQSPGNASLAADGIVEFANSWGGVRNTANWQVDFKNDKTVTRVETYSENPGVFAGHIYYSGNGSDWTEAASTLVACISGDKCFRLNSSTTARYWRFTVIHNGAVGDEFLFEISFYPPANATHISAADQITNANLYQWQTFTPHSTFSGTQANTSIKYNFRTSITGTDNDADWTDWSTDQDIASGEEKVISGIVTSKTGDPGSETFYKYIQVKTTLTSTDGTSTPIIEDYTIGYHSNVAPNKPAAGSVTIGS